MGNKLKKLLLYGIVVSLPLAPCGLFSSASSQVLDPRVPCFPVDPEGQAGPCPLGPLSSPVLLGALVRTDGHSDKEIYLKWASH